MNQRVAEPEISTVREESSVEDYLRTLWDRIRTAGDMIRDLRHEKHLMGTRIGELERELVTLRSDIQQREQELKKLRSERVQILSASGNSGFSAEEKEALRARIHDIISKINSHL